MSKEKYEDAVLTRWKPLVEKVENLNGDQKYILSQLLENVQREYGENGTDIETMKIIIPLTCQIFKLIKDDLPDTYPMKGPVDKKEEKIIEAKARKLKNGKFNLILVNQDKYNENDIIDTVVGALYEDIAKEIREECLNNETYYPYILVAPSIKGVYQLITKYGEMVA